MISSTSNKITYKDESERLSGDVEKILQQSNLNLCNGKWEEYLIAPNLQLVSSLQSNTADLQGNFYSHILKELADVGFPSLTFLNLINNNIQSIEILDRIWLPSLETLDISGSYITKISNFRKCSFPQLRRFDFSGNKIIDGNKLTEFNSDFLEDINISGQYDKEQCCDARWILKLQVSFVEAVWINDGERIKNQSLQMELGGKYEIATIHQ